MYDCKRLLLQTTAATGGLISLKMPLSDVGVRFDMVASEDKLRNCPDFSASRRTKNDSRAELSQSDGTARQAIQLQFLLVFVLVATARFPLSLAMFLHGM